MARIDFEDGVFVFYHGRDRRRLLDCKDLLANKSRLPMNIASDMSVVKLLMQLKNSHIKIADGTGWSAGSGPFSAFLMDILATSLFISTSVPLRVVELGATDGVLSYHLAELMGKINKKSSLCCVCSVIGNESGNHWLDKIVQVEQPPKLSLLVSDYEDIQLQTHSFDLVILNGAVQFDQPYEMLREAERLVKKEGNLFCYAKNAPLLESCFTLVFPQRQEYEITPQERLLTVQYEGTSWGKSEKMKLENDGKALACKIFEICSTSEVKNRKQQLELLLKQLDMCTNRAIQEYDLAWKLRLMRLKEFMLDYMLSLGTELEDFYKKELVERIPLLIEA